jgi:hypothetical protein
MLDVYLSSFILICIAAWLLDHFTLHDQGILPDETLEYAKKFFFSDDKVDFDDPFTLHVYYLF